jgi:hypothetical protein
MRSLIIILFFIAGTGCRAQGQDDKAQVSAVVDKLFKGMALGDSTMVRACFTDTVTTATIFRDPGGRPHLRREDGIEGFLRAVGTPHPEPWNEEIWHLAVRVDGDLAQVWCDYAFYVGNRFSHCGVDAFQFYRTKEGWKIFHLADTRRATDCDVPDEIRDKHKP